MRKSILLILAVLVLSLSFAETVNLNRIVYNGAEGKYVKIQLYNSPSFVIKSTPVLKDESYGTLTINGQNFNIAFGKSSQGYELYVDTDNNGYFDSFNKVILNETQNSLYSLPVILPLEHNGKTYPYIVKFNIFLNSETPNIYYSCAFWRSGTVKIGSNVYDVELVNLGSNGRFDCLDDDVIGINVQKGASFGRFYTLKFSNKIQLGDSIYSVEAVNVTGTQLTLGKIGKATNKFSLNVGDKIKGLNFALLTDSSTIITSLDQLKKEYTLIFTWYLDGNSSLNSMFAKHMESLNKKFGKDVNFIGIDADYPVSDSDAYKNMNLRVYMKQNKLTFKQMDYLSGLRVMQALNMNFSGGILLIGKDGTIIYKSIPVWTMNGGLFNLAIDFDQLNSLLSSLCSK